MSLTDFPGLLHLICCENISMFGFFENGVEEIKRFFSPEKGGMNVSLFSPLLSKFRC